MAYVKQNFVKGQILTAEHMNHIENGIVAAADAQSLGGKAPAYYLQPRNLLDNSNFRSPVNQRGASSYTTTGAYGIDRWFQRTSSSVTVNSGSITVTGKMKQRLLSAAQDGTYTLAAGNADGSVTILTTHGWDNDAGCYYVELPAGEYVWAALYEGAYTADTLPPYIPKGYTVELMACLQYYRRGMQAVTIGKQYSDNTVFSIVFPKMRVSPTVQLLGIISQGWGNVDENTYQTEWSENRGSDYYINFASSVTDDVGKTVVVVYESSADL